MPLDQSFIGRSYAAPRRYEVGLEKIREFADAVGDPNPVYRDPEAAKAAGYPAVIAPPTFAMVPGLEAIQRIVADPELGLDWSRVVHGDSSFEYTRPVMAGDSLELVATIDNVMNRAGSGFLTVRADISAQGENVVTLTAMIVVRGE